MLRHTLLLPHHQSHLATAEAEAAGQVANMIGIEQSVVTEVAAGVATEGEPVAQAAIYLGDNETGIVLGVLGVLGTIGEMANMSSSSNGTGSEKVSGGGFFLNSKYKELLYIADDELFQTESSGLLKQKNTKNSYNLSRIEEL